jgi:hypothetical protein
MKSSGPFCILPAAIYMALASFCDAQKPPNLVGDYSATSGPISVKLHMVAEPNGSLACTVDSPQQNLKGLPCADVHQTGAGLSFTVPTVNGSWMGFMGSDGNTLSGMWSQGQPFPLNFTRGAGGTGIVAPAQPVSTSNAPVVGCPTNSFGNYWDGTSWRPLKQVVALKRETDVSAKEMLKDPLNPMAQYVIIDRYKSVSADLKLTSKPRFCFPLAVNSSAQGFIVVLDVKNNARQIENKKSDKHSTGSRFPDGKLFDVDLDQSSVSSFEVTPKKPLPPGQYLISAGIGTYDFAVE